MKRRLRSLTRITKISSARTFVSRALIISLIAVLLSSVFVALSPPKTVSADNSQGFAYTDKNYSAIKGVLLSDGGPVTFNKTSGTNYDAGTPSGVGCHATIKTSSRGSSDGTLSLSSCLDGNDSSRSIHISPAQNYKGAWVDHNHIKVGNDTYYDNQTDDNDSYSGPDNGCGANTINGFPHKGGDPSNATATATITINAPVSDTNGNCISTQYPITFTDTNNYYDYFVWVDAGTIQTADGTAMTFAQKNGSGPYRDDGSGRSSDSKCISTVTADPNNPSKGTLVLRNSSGNPFTGGFSPQITNASFHDNSGCQVSSQIPINLGDTQNAKKAAGTGTTGNGSTNNNGNATLSCAFSDNPLSWIMCPIIDGLVKVIDWVDGLITDQLTVPTDSIFCNNSDSCAAYYAAWQSFRNISLGLIAIAGLVMVTSQAMGMEILDAYAIRKTLPRLLIAIVGITLSWPLVKFLIILSNDLGFGLRDLLQAPFHRLAPEIKFDFGGDFVNLFFGGATTVLGGVIAIPVWMAFGGPMALLAYALTAALAILVAILVLILRQVVIILLMLLAPIAIVLYVLPNTQRFYKLWWESFSKALLMFPLIVGFITAGRIFAAIALNNSQTGVTGAIDGLIGFIAYFAPYFMIPMTFRMAGQTMGAFGNFVQQRSQGGFQALSKMRAGQRQSRIERARARGFYRGSNRLARFANKVGLYTLDADEQLAYDIGSGTGVGRATGRVGKRLFGRMAAEQAGVKANLLAEHTAKGVEKANMHYSTAWAALGMRKKFAGNMSAEGLAAMDEKYGVDEDGNWKNTPQNADHHGLVEYAHDLQKFGLDGGEAQFAGRELEAKAGILSSFGLHMDTQRASLEGVAAAVAAKEGKLGADDLAGIYNRTMDTASKNGPVAMAFAHAQMAQLENAASANRQDLRRGKGVRLDKNGRAYSVYSRDRMIEEPNLDGKVIPAYMSDKAYESAKSMKGTAASNAKAETVTEMAPVYESIMKGDRPDLLAKNPDLQNTTRETILYGAANPYSDIDQRTEWKKIAATVKISQQEVDEKTAEIERRATREQGATGGGAPGGGDSFQPPTLPGGGGGLGAPGLGD